LKILFLPKVKNLFFPKLVEGLSSFDLEVCSDTEKFWQEPFPFDVLHIHFPEAFYCWDRCRQEGSEDHCSEKFLSRLKVLKSKGVTVVWTVHNLEPHDRINSNRDREIFKTFIECCSGIIIQCGKAGELLEEQYPETKNRIKKIIPHINYIDCYPNNISRKEARLQLDCKIDDFLFLSFGLIRTYKDIPLLLKAFNGLSGKHKNIRLLIAGALSEDIGWKTKLKIYSSSMFNSRIVLKTEYVKDQDVQVFFNAADACVFSYRKIFMSGAVILAQSFGLPIIAPDSGCIADYVTPETGFLFESGNHRDLAGKMEQVFSMDFSRMGKKAKRIQLENNYLKIAENTFEFYQELMEHNK